MGDRNLTRMNQADGLGLFTLVTWALAHFALKELLPLGRRPQFSDRFSGGTRDRTLESRHQLGTALGQGQAGRGSPLCWKMARKPLTGRWGGDEGG